MCIRHTVGNHYHILLRPHIAVNVKKVTIEIFQQLLIVEWNSRLRLSFGAICVQARGCKRSMRFGPNRPLSFAVLPLPMTDY